MPPARCIPGCAWVAFSQELARFIDASSRLDSAEPQGFQGISPGNGLASMRLVTIMGNVFRDSNLGAIWRSVPKLDVAGSIPVSRSSLSNHLETSPNR
jgi:hypothetical protein